MGDTKDDCEKLFLLEVLVDKLSILEDSLNLDDKLRSNLTDTCVFFQFLHYPPLVVCESDFLGTPVGRHDNTDITFKSGKSCFFSLRTPRGHVFPVNFDVKVTVVRRLKEGVLPDKLELGKTSISMTEEFTELLRINTDENCDCLPLSKVKKGVFEIRDVNSRQVGNVAAFFRLSCFGKLIITQFSLNKEDEKSYLFKGTDVSKIGKGEALQRPVFERKGDRVGEKSVQPPPSNWLSGEPKPQEARPCQERRFSQPVRQYRPDYQRPSRPPPKARICPDIRPCGCPADYPHRRPPPVPPAGRGGRSSICQCYPPGQSNYREPSKYTFQKPGRNLGLSPGEVGLDVDKVIFQLPLKKQGEPLTEKNKDIDSSVYYKLTSAEETQDGQQKNTVHIKSDDLPGMAKKQVGPVSGLPVDDTHDVLLLKFGRKCEGDKKRNLELELRTPKMKEPEPCMTDRDTQYLESDIPQPEKQPSKDKKGKGKGKGKGKDKGKKGKKK